MADAIPKWKPSMTTGKCNEKGCLMERPLWWYDCCWKVERDNNWIWKYRRIRYKTGPLSRAKGKKEACGNLTISPVSPLCMHYQEHLLMRHRPSQFCMEQGFCRSLYALVLPVCHFFAINLILLDQWIVYNIFFYKSPIIIPISWLCSTCFSLSSEKGEKRCSNDSWDLRPLQLKGKLSIFWTGSENLSMIPLV